MVPSWYLYKTLSYSSPPPPSILRLHFCRHPRSREVYPHLFPTSFRNPQPRPLLRPHTYLQNWACYNLYLVHIMTQSDVHLHYFKSLLSQIPHKGGGGGTPIFCQASPEVVLRLSGGPPCFETPPASLLCGGSPPTFMRQIWERPVKTP